ncbi:MAG TPA: diguanylate cyclase [Gemmatimonadaceae bacterium]|nr:diguanylate cyclase [Gemmatimonadaceae bacterium]
MAGEETRPARVLIVDDHPDNLELLRVRLEAWGYEVRAAASGEQAIRSVRDDAPDLILLDVMMPEMDGHEVARRIKSDPSVPFIPIIMQTALDSVAHKVRGLDAGADDYITKPINFDELEARLHSMLRIKRLHLDLEAANAELRRMATIDGLTGVFNRRHLEERFHEMFEHAWRLHEPLACVIFDLDHFKSVNDTHGHRAGDQVLRQFADLLRRSAREVDRVGRYGGEEFLVILPGTVLDAAVTFGERTRQEVEETVFSSDEGPLRRTVSGGVAAWPHPRIRTRDDLLKAADDALYVAKALGRNRVVRFDSADFNAHAETAHAQHPGRSPAARHAGQGEHRAEHNL